MKRSKANEAQIAFILQQAETGRQSARYTEKAGIAEAAFYNWRKKLAGLMPSEIKRLVADLSLDKAMLQDVGDDPALQSHGEPENWRGLPYRNWTVRTAHDETQKKTSTRV